MEILIGLLSLSLFFFSLEKCHGPCISSSNCSQPCAKDFRGEIGFTCNQKKWQKSTETCTSLSVEKLFKVMHSKIIGDRSQSPRRKWSIFSVICSAWQKVSDLQNLPSGLNLEKSTEWVTFVSWPSFLTQTLRYSPSSPHALSFYH